MPRGSKGPPPGQTKAGENAFTFPLAHLCWANEGQTEKRGVFKPKRKRAIQDVFLVASGGKKMTHSGLYSILATATLTGTNGTNGTNAPIMPIMPINKAMGLTIDSLSSPFSLRGESSFTKAGGEGGLCQISNGQVRAGLPFFPGSGERDWIYAP